MAAAFACLGLDLRELRESRRRRMEADGRRVGCILFIICRWIGMVVLFGSGVTRDGRMREGRGCGEII